MSFDRSPYGLSDGSPYGSPYGLSDGSHYGLSDGSNFEKVRLVVIITSLTNKIFLIEKENEQLKLENQRLKQQLENALQPHTQGLSAPLTGFFEPISRKRPIEGEGGQLFNAKRHQGEFTSTSINQPME
jgi:hypothetical protein